MHYMLLLLYFGILVLWYPIFSPVLVQLADITDASTCCSLFLLHKQSYAPDCHIHCHSPAQTDCSCNGPMQTLYLSKNCLRSLQGIQQFGALVTLALADNLIDSFDQLEFLVMASQGHTLRALSLEGNPIARLPNYRFVGDTVTCT